ncbi:LLM class F420-dependent oxidoreductase [Reticulibacter mediterranei]|uniref:LLM class F420-dependent oxidoreductase n=1 Tax=Reticulibacter mediterranei TaxID=2778369 RepID=A0A8J3IPY5_9CHLR|nr:LLM class flavin-dependent oxidoreductase [Reticulibacter mediterranei]GHO98028.1 LLM class F420-dependent oxidoreductase [Reticulibacter mediterranei]
MMPPQDHPNALTQRSLRDRVGVCIEGSDPVDSLSQFRAAELAGVQQVWMTAGGAGSGSPDTLTLFATAAAQTRHIRLGTAITVTYLRHPLLMAQQALVIHALAPGRLRLGIGPGARESLEGWYGLEVSAPLSYQKEYVQILRGSLWESSADFHGTFFQTRGAVRMGNFDAVITASQSVQIPLLVAALGAKAFQQAGEIADGALSWMCPVPYLLNQARPALQVGAEIRSRPVPPLVAHLMVAMSTDEAAVLAAVRQRVQVYARVSGYARAFVRAGFAEAVEGDEKALDALARALVISGDESTVRQRIQELVEQGLDELMLQLVPVTSETSERERLFHLVGSLKA